MATWPRPWGHGTATWPPPGGHTMATWPPARGASAMARPVPTGRAIAFHPERTRLTAPPSISLLLREAGISRFAGGSEGGMTITLSAIVIWLLIGLVVGGLA